MPERLLGSSMGLLQKGMEEILDWNEEKEKKSPSFSGPRLSVAGTPCAPVLNTVLG